MASLISNPFSGTPAHSVSQALVRPPGPALASGTVQNLMVSKESSLNFLGYFIPSQASKLRSLLTQYSLLNDLF